MTKTKIIILAVVVFAIIAIASAVGFGYYYFFKKPILHKDVWVYVSPTTTTNDIFKQLDEGELSLDELATVKMAQEFIEKKEGKKLEESYGAYLLKKDLSAARIITTILRHQQTPVKVTFNEARLLTDLAGKMSKGLMCDSIAMLDAILNPEFIAECETDKANIIGVFLPDTYEVYWDIAPEKFVRKMYGEYKKFWNEERKAKAEALGITPKQATIICSIAEEETQNRAERGVVARLYLNRYQIGMPLQADPTVKYAVGDFSLKRVLNAHLLADSPYNTYRVAGLPPGPIRMVEKATINALLDSKPHQYLYMCAKEDFSGTHNFATNLADHNRNAQRYHAAVSQLLSKSR